MDHEINKYNLLHKLDQHQVFDENNIMEYDSHKKRELAQFLHDNYNRLDNEELKYILPKYLNPTDIRRILLDFELKYYKPPKPKNPISIPEFLKYAKYIFTRYQGKAGGYLLEDLEWAVYAEGDSKYDVNPNELVLENTMDISDYSNNELEDYLDNISVLLESLGTNIRTKVTYKERESDRIIYVLISVNFKPIPEN